MISQNSCCAQRTTPFLRTLTLLVAMFLFNAALTAQHTISGNCGCLTFVYACSGQLATALVGAEVQLYCSGRSEEAYIGENATLCPSGSSWSCVGSLATPSICLSEDNWEICSIVSCTVYVEQTLDIEPTINGTMLGYGEYAVPCQSGTNTCYGRIYTGCLNTLAGATEILACPGDDLILHFDDLVIPSASGMCLYVTIKTSSGTYITAHKYPYNEVSGGSVDITDLLDGLDTDETYIIDMELNCCSGASSTCFMTNNHYYAYIYLRGKFDYELTAVGTGSGGPYVPSTTPYGPIVPTVLYIGMPPIPVANTIAFYGQNVVNLASVDEIDWVLWDIDCSGGSTENELGSGTIEPEPMESEIEDAFTTGIIGWAYTGTTCKCYRLDLTFDNGCDEDPVTESYYFRCGGDCFAGPSDPPIDKILEGTTGKGLFKIGVSTNPVRDDILKLDYSGQWPEDATRAAILYIKDASGRTVSSQQITFDGRHARVPLNATSGIYFYTVRTGDQSFSGKFVKN